MAAKKATRKAGAGKRTARKKPATRKGSRKKAARRSSKSLVGDDLPRSLKAFGRQLRRDLTAVEKQIEVAGKDTRRSLARVVRDASHQLGTLEARGEREWRALSRAAQRDVERIVERVRDAMPGAKSRKKKASKKKSRKKKASRKKASRKKASRK